MTMESDPAGAAIAEAIATLGYVTPTASKNLLKLLPFCSVHHPKSIITKYRKLGKQLSENDKRAAGMRANAFMSTRAFSELTDKGKDNPLHSHETTLLRAWFSFSRHHSFDDSKSKGFKVFKYDGMFSDQCVGCRRLDGKMFKADDVDTSIPHDCSREACSLAISPFIDHFGDSSDYFDPPKIT